VAHFVAFTFCNKQSQSTPEHNGDASFTAPVSFNLHYVKSKHSVFGACFVLFMFLAKVIGLDFTQNFNQVINQAELPGGAGFVFL